MKQPGRLRCCLTIHSMNSPLPLPLIVTGFRPYVSVVLIVRHKQWFGFYIFYMSPDMTTGAIFHTLGHLHSMTTGICHGEHDCQNGSGTGHKVWLLTIQYYLKGYTQLHIFDQMIRTQSLFRKKCSRCRWTLQCKSTTLSTGIPLASVLCCKTNLLCSEMRYQMFLFFDRWWSVGPSFSPILFFNSPLTNHLPMIHDRCHMRAIT